jgi:hypothetical protein
MPDNTGKLEFRMKEYSAAPGSMQQDIYQRLSRAHCFTMHYPLNKGPAHKAVF